MNIFKKLFKQSEDHLEEEVVNSPSFYSDDSAEEEHLIIENEEKQRIEKEEKREQIKKNKEQFIVDHEATKLGDLIIRDLGESSLEIVLGKTESGEKFLCDFKNIPHILISGSTGTGKTELIRSLISGLVINHRDKELIIYVYSSKPFEYTDMVSTQNNIVLVSSKDDAVNLARMILSVISNRISEYKKSTKADFPEIFFIMDDLSDLSEEEKFADSIDDILRLGRVVGVHCIMCTSTPSYVYVNKDIRANLTHRIAFFSTTKRMSKMILDDDGAEKLKSPDEFIFKERNNMIRLHSIMIENPEVIKDITTVFTNPLEIIDIGLEDVEDIQSADPQYEDVKKFVIVTGKASTSAIQRYFGFGYNRAARLLYFLEKEGIVGPANGSKPRIVYYRSIEEDKY